MKKIIKLILLVMIGLISLSFISNSIALDYNENFTVMDYTTEGLDFLEISTPSANNGYRYHYQLNDYSTTGYNHKNNKLLAESLDGYSYALSQAYVNINQDDTTMWNETSSNFTSSLTFDNNSIDNLSNWTIYEPVNTDVSIVNSQASTWSHPFYYDTLQHQNLLRIYDNSLSGYCSAEYSFQEIENGSISFWFIVEDTSFLFNIYLYFGSQVFFYLDVSSDYLRIHDGASTTNIKEIEDNVWYYLQLDFNSVDNEIVVNVDNAFIGIYDSYNTVNYDYVNSILFKTDTSQENEMYLDAFEVSWNKTTGLYNSSYSFTDDIIGSVPDNFYDYSGSGCSQTVELVLDNHSKVVKLYDASSSTYAGTHQQFTPRNSGTVEFWIYATDNSQSSYYQLINAIGDAIILRISSGYIQVRYSGSYHNLQEVSINTWYHIRIDFEASTSGYLGLSQYYSNIYINDNLYANQPFNNNRQDLYRVVINTATTEIGYTIYFDALGYSWFDNYTINQNRYPITFENQFNINDNYFPISSIENNQYYEYYSEIYFLEGVNYQILYYNISIWKEQVIISTRKKSSEFDLNYSQVINYSNVNSFEIEIHSYFGANENASFACNSKLIIKVNDVLNFTLISSMENIDIGINAYVVVNERHFRPKKFNFNTYCNILEGYRGLANIDTSYHYNNFLDFPSFKENILIPDFDIPDLPSDFHREVEWHYTGYLFKYSYSNNITSTHFNFEYPYITIDTIDMIHGFDYWHASFSYGAWYDVIYNALVLLAGLILNAINIIWNLVIFGLILALNFIILYVIVGLVMLIVWNLLLPLLIWSGLQLVELFIGLYVLLMTLINWIFDIAVPAIIIGGTILLSLFISLFLWMLTGFQANYANIVYTVNTLLTQITLGIYEIFLLILQNILIVLLYFGAYVLCVQLVFGKYYVCKARGFKARSERIYESYLSYRIVIQVPIAIVNWFKRLIFRWT